MVTAAHVISPTAVHPSNRSRNGLVRFPMTLGLLVSRITIAMSGAASTPLTTADQNSISMALMPIIQSQADQHRDSDHDIKPGSQTALNLKRLCQYWREAKLVFA